MKKIVRRPLLIFLSVLVIVSAFGPAQKVEAKNTVYHQKGGKWTNGKKTFYMKGGKLYKKTQSKKAKILAEFKEKNSSYMLATVYGEYVFVERSDYNTFRSMIYSVNINTGKKKKTAQGCVQYVSGKYIYAYPFVNTSHYPYHLSVYKIKGNKLKKVRSVGKQAIPLSVYKNRLYYASYPISNSMSHMTLCCCKPDGSSKKKLLSLTCDDKLDEIACSPVKNGRISIIAIEGYRETYYQYTIKTGRLTEISGDDYYKNF